MTDNFAHYEATNLGACKDTDLDTSFIEIVRKDVVVYLALRYRLSTEHARVIAVLAGIGGRS